MFNGTPPRAKALPSRPSQDNGYNGGSSNGYRNDTQRDYGSSPPMAARKPLPAPGSPTPKTVLEGYRQDIMTGFEEEKPRYNPMNVSRPQSSMLLNVNDEIQVHLLVETALGDSKEYEILSQEEVDDLKRHVQALSQRIEQTKSNLAIQSKYRDAALNMSRLYSNASRNSGEGTDGKRRRSLLGHNRTPSHEVREADLERQQSERRCEELAAELWSLEKRLMVPQNRLLKHTAGILQMTHKGPTTPKVSKSSQQGGIPGSPESMYTYHNSRNSMEQIGEEDFFDERSLYRNADVMWEEVTKDVGAPIPSGSSKEQMELIATTEQKLEDLNSRLRNVLLKVNPQRPLPSPPRGIDEGENMQSYLEILDENISTIDREFFELGQEHDGLMKEYQDLANMHQGLINEQTALTKEHQDLIRKHGGLQNDHQELVNKHGDLLGKHSDLMKGQQESGAALGNMEQTETVMMGLWDIIQSGEEETRQRKLQRRQTRSSQNLPDEDDSPDEDNDPDQPFSLQGFSAKVQWLYTQATRLKEQKKVLQRQIQQQRDLNSKSDATKDAEFAQKVEELTRTTALLTRTEADADSVREQLSLVMEKLDEARQQESLRDQARSNGESAAVRQIQEELNQRISKNAQLEEELQDLKDDSSIANAEMQVKIGDTESKLANLTKELTAATAAAATYDTLVQQKDQQIKIIEQKIQEKQQEINQRDQDISMKNQALQSKDQELAAKIQALQTKEQEIREKDQKLKSTEEELEEMNMEVANLKTEVTIARAELDGAYGSRAQRAAEGASNPALQNELSELALKNINLSAEIAQLRDQNASKRSSNSTNENDEKMKMLKSELAETIEEYEQMTKASIEWEKEREMLEGTIDKLRDEREGLEAQLSDEKVRWLGMRSPGPDGQMPMGMGGNTSTTVLKNEFKKMMRDTRAESSKALRVEQDQRRRLEDELRALKKQHGPGKSGLSQSYGSS